MGGQARAVERRHTTHTCGAAPPSPCPPPPLPPLPQQPPQPGVPLPPLPPFPPTDGGGGGVGGASPPPPWVPPPPGSPYVFVDLTPDQKRRMYQLTSIFENSDVTLQYGYAERLHDGRGVTFGYCGFCTGERGGGRGLGAGCDGGGGVAGAAWGACTRMSAQGRGAQPLLLELCLARWVFPPPSTPLPSPFPPPHAPPGEGDGILVVKAFSKLSPGNPLEKYLGALAKLQYAGDKFTGISGFEKAVQKLGNDPLFIKAQQAVGDSEYYIPSTKWCKMVGCNLALTKAQLYGERACVCRGGGGQGARALRAKPCVAGASGRGAAGAGWREQSLGGGVGRPAAPPAG